MSRESILAPVSGRRDGHFFEIENKINPTPSMIRVMGQGSGSPRGFGLPRIMRMESHIKRIPDTMKHAFAIFNKVDLPENLIYLPPPWHSVILLQEINILNWFLLFKTSANKRISLSCIDLTPCTLFPKERARFAYGVVTPDRRPGSVGISRDLLKQRKVLIK